MAALAEDQGISTMKADASRLAIRVIVPLPSIVADNHTRIWGYF
jgi:hypothetical protein